MSAHNDPTSAEPILVNGVDVRDEPSAAWGWHGLNLKALQSAGWVSVAVLLFMAFFGNHKGKVEVIWGAALAVVIALGLIIAGKTKTAAAKRRRDERFARDIATAQAGAGGALHWNARKKPELHSEHVTAERAHDPHAAKHRRQLEHS